MAETNGFWTTSAARDPKRGFRFRVTFDTLANLQGVAWYAKKATKPSISFSEASQHGCKDSWTCFHALLSKPHGQNHCTVRTH